MEGGLIVLETTLPPTAAAASNARKQIAIWMGGLVGAKTTESVLLATSEVVTNAVHHGDSTQEIALNLELTEFLIRVEVGQEASAAGAHVVGPTEQGSGGGFGLAIVQAIAHRWGVETGPPGWVWFEILRD